MAMSSFLSFSPKLIERVREAPYNYVVTGANGWLGSATLAMLRQALGEAFETRVTALGSRYAHPVQALLQWQPPQDQAIVIFHYAFLTKDKVGGLSTDDYSERNAAISIKVRGWIEAGHVRGVVLPSSGAVYDHLFQKTRDPAAGLYGRLKYQDELAFTKSCTAHNTGLIIPRVFNLSGPYINKFDSYALASFIQSVLLGKRISIRAQKPVLRSYYHIGDLIELSLQLLLKQVTASVDCFDTAGCEIVELAELAQRTMSILTDCKHQEIIRMPIVRDATIDRYVGNREKIAVIENCLDLQPKSLNEQISLTARYMQSLL